MSNLTQYRLFIGGEKKCAFWSDLLLSDTFSLSVFSINAENNGMEVPVELNGIHLLMDTGAGVSIISQEAYNRHFKSTPLQFSCDSLYSTNVRLEDIRVTQVDCVLQLRLDIWCEAWVYATYFLPIQFDTGKPIFFQRVVVQSR